ITARRAVPPEITARRAVPPMPPVHGGEGLVDPERVGRGAEMSAGVDFEAGLCEREAEEFDAAVGFGCVVVMDDEGVELAVGVEGWGDELCGGGGGAPGELACDSRVVRRRVGRGTGERIAGTLPYGR